MAALNFPDAPSPGQTFSNWSWDGSKWVPTVGVVGGAPFIGAAPPANPSPGALWWDDVGGQLYIYYNDGNSSQWVLANVSPQGIPGPTGPQGPVGTSLPMGVTTGSNASAGQVGEYVKVSGMGTSTLPVNTNGTLSPSLVLTPGDWEVTGNVFFQFSVASGQTIAVSSMAASLQLNGSGVADTIMQFQLDTFGATNPTLNIAYHSFSLPATRINPTVQATLNFLASWGGSNTTVNSSFAGGWMAGRRMR